MAAKKSSAERKAETEKKLAEEMAERKAKADAWYDAAQGAYASALASYEEAAIEPRVALDYMDDLSKALTSQFQTVRVSITYECGEKRLSVEPRPPRRIHPTRWQDQAPPTWPKPSDVANWAEGYVSGLRKGRDEIDNLKHELRHAKQSLGNDCWPHPMMSVHPMFMRPFYGR